MKIVCDIFLYTFDTHGYTYFVVFTVAILLIAYLVVMLWLQNREKALLTRSLAHLASMKRHGVEYELVLQAMKLATWRIDLRDMTLTFENDYRSMPNLYTPVPGTPMNEVLKLLMPEDAEKMREVLKGVKVGKQDIYHLQFRIKEGNGDYYWSDIYGTISERDDDGKPITFIGTAKNIDKQKKQVSFTASGNVGNAVIALYKENGGAKEIVWSFHIWSSEKSLEDMAVANWQSLHLVTEDKSLTWLDRNIGALNAKNTDNAGIHGNVYQWGRKDPFPGASRTGIGTVKEGTTSTFVTGFGAKDDEVFGSATIPYIVNSALTEGFTASKDITTVAESAKSPMHFGSDGANWASDIDVKALRLSTHGKAGLRALTRRRLTRPQERQPARRPTTTHAL